MISNYSASIPVFITTLEALSGILDKASEHCAGKNIDPTVMTGTRLTPDMFALSRQVQVACDFAKNTAARLANVDPAKFADDEKTLIELKDRIRRTVEYISSLDSEAIAASNGREIEFSIARTPMKMEATNYILHFAMPHFYFHVSMAYAILRQAGVPIGKRDFIGNVPGIQPA
jgi:hypothetical protein